MTLGPSQESLKQMMTRNQTLLQRSQVAKMQSEILEQARIHGMKSRQVREKQKRLMKSREGRIEAFTQVITNQGKNTPGVDGEIFTREDQDRIVTRLARTKDYRSKPVKRVMIPKANGK